MFGTPTVVKAKPLSSTRSRSWSSAEQRRSTLSHDGWPSRGSDRAAKEGLALASLQRLGRRRQPATTKRDNGEQRERLVNAAIHGPDLTGLQYYGLRPTLGGEAVKAVVKKVRHEA